VIGINKKIYYFIRETSMDIKIPFVLYSINMEEKARNNIRAEAICLPGVQSSAKKMFPRVFFNFIGMPL